VNILNDKGRLAFSNGDSNNTTRYSKEYGAERSVFKRVSKDSSQSVDKKSIDLTKLSVVYDRRDIIPLAEILLHLAPGLINQQAYLTARKLIDDQQIARRQQTQTADAGSDTDGAPF